MWIFQTPFSRNHHFSMEHETPSTERQILATFTWPNLQKNGPSNHIRWKPPSWRLWWGSLINGVLKWTMLGNGPPKIKIERVRVNFTWQRGFPEKMPWKLLKTLGPLFSLASHLNLHCRFHFNLLISFVFREKLRSIGWACVITPISKHCCN